MGNKRRKLYALIIAGASFILVIGAMLTALAETGFSPAQSEPTTDTAIPIATSTVDKSTAIPVVEIPTSTQEDSQGQPTATKSINTPTNTLTEIPTFLTTATQTSTTAATQIFTCSKPLGWINYTVQSGDTLYSIAVRHQTNVATLQVGNCMGSSTKIITGSILWVPNNPTITPSLTNTPTKTKVVCYTLTLSIIGDGSALTATPQKSDGCTAGKYVAGEKITLTAEPAAGWSIGGWTGTDDDSIKDKTNKVTMPASNHSASVTYLAPTCYSLTLSHTGNGSDPAPSINNSPGCSPGSYIEGEIITLSAAPATGWAVVNWTNTDNDSSTAEANTVTIPANNYAASVNYEAICYTLTLSFTGTGSAPTASPSQSATCTTGFVVGEMITLTAYPDSGSVVTGWTGTDDPTSNTLTMPASNHEVIVHYSP